MKRLLLPTVLIAFAIICLSIVHIDNINKLDAQSKELREKHQEDKSSEIQINNSTVTIPETK